MNTELVTFAVLNSGNCWGFKLRYYFFAAFFFAGFFLAGFFFSPPLIDPIFSFPFCRECTGLKSGAPWALISFQS
jgi:hypothetical protein